MTIDTGKGSGQNYSIARKWVCNPCLLVRLWEGGAFTPLSAMWDQGWACLGGLWPESWRPFTDKFWRR